MRYIKKQVCIEEEMRWKSFLDFSHLLSSWQFIQMDEALNIVLSKLSHNISE
jgi:hypothetical protein